MEIEERLKRIEEKLEINAIANLTKERNELKADLEFIRESIVGSEAITDFYVDNNWHGISKKGIVIKVRKNATETSSYFLGNDALSQVLKQALGRDKGKPFEYAYNILREFFTIKK